VRAFRAPTASGVSPAPSAIPSISSPSSGAQAEVAAGLDQRGIDPVQAREEHQDQDRERIVAGD